MGGGGEYINVIQNACDSRGNRPSANAKFVVRTFANENVLATVSCEGHTGFRRLPRVEARSGRVRDQKEKEKKRNKRPPKGKKNVLSIRETFFFFALCFFRELPIPYPHSPRIIDLFFSLCFFATAIIVLFLRDTYTRHCKFTWSSAVSDSVVRHFSSLHNIATQARSSRYPAGIEIPRWFRFICTIIFQLVRAADRPVELQYLVDLASMRLTIIVEARCSSTDVFFSLEHTFFFLLKPHERLEFFGNLGTSSGHRRNSIQF